MPKVSFRRRGFVCIRVERARILCDGHLSDCLLLTTLMDFYAICGCGNEGARVFDEMPDRDTRFENGCKPDNVTCLLLLQGSAQLCGLSFGEKVYDYVEEHGYGKSVKRCNSLIAMYTRCGCVDKAIRVFRGYSGVLRYAPEGGGHLDCIDYWAGDKWTRFVAIDLSHSLFSSIEGPHKLSLMATKHDSTATPIAATGDVIQTRMEHLVQPLLPTKAKGKPDLSRQKSVEK
ncbi:hypothetical protein GIB67_021395 [Kingdonia uniflora]|uniref:Pentatricopeptide repeat-containing protein n=1 Tax=Kingdonia uniflora TaxID=39325 RepID=A0A7J7MCX0_9MAGN|nr:hypothetical protein GIB67_021395 [Kingdonia uniflora]